MNWYKKNLPAGFIYMVNRRDMKTIDDSSGNIIKAVFLDGPSYRESKVYQKFPFGKAIAFIKSHKDDTKEGRFLVVYINLFGIRESNFETKEQLEEDKNRVKKDLLDKITYNIEAFNNNDPILEFQSIALK
jgi:hypothetical protein